MDGWEIELQRQGWCPIRTKEQLRIVCKYKDGFIFNESKYYEKENSSILHQTTCQTLDKMTVSHSNTPEKFYFKNIDLALQWLRKNRDEDSWFLCELCCDW